MSPPQTDDRDDADDADPAAEGKAAEDASDSGQAEHSQPLLVAVTVVRTGGIAGTRREWRAEPPAEEAPRWIELIEECPWDAAVELSASRGADRFVWRIDARCGPRERGAELPDSAVHGPWRELVDHVRAAGAGPAR
ncbi:MAG: protealysin inhibitor emfourin [Microbacterium sp.]